jgi:hypothetical protein
MAECSRSPTSKNKNTNHVHSPLELFQQAQELVFLLKIPVLLCFQNRVLHPTSKLRIKPHFVRVLPLRSAGPRTRAPVRTFFHYFHVFTSLLFIHSRTFQDQDDKTNGLNLRFCLCSSLLELYLYLQYTPFHINLFANKPHFTLRK